MAESQDVQAHKAYNMMSELNGYLRAATEEDWTALLRQDRLDAADVRKVRGKLKLMMDRAALKAEQFLASEKPAWQFLQEIRALDPNQLLSLPLHLTLYESIPGLKATSAMVVQWKKYEKSVRALQGEVCPDIFKFCQEMLLSTPDLAKIDSEYLFVPVNSVYTEHSFSTYKNVVSDKRHNLSAENTAMLVGLYYNTCNGPDCTENP